MNGFSPNFRYRQLLSLLLIAILESSVVYVLLLWRCPYGAGLHPFTIEWRLHIACRAPVDTSGYRCWLVLGTCWHVWFSVLTCPWHLCSRLVFGVDLSVTPALTSGFRRWLVLGTCWHVWFLALTSPGPLLSHLVFEVYLTWAPVLTSGFRHWLALGTCYHVWFSVLTSPWYLLPRLVFDD